MDVHHIIGDDILLDKSNDLAFVFDTDETNQRIMRRLFTNKGTYIWNAKWGASIPWRVGDTLSAEVYREIVNEIRAAVLEDGNVAKDPLPEITIEQSSNGLICYIRYYNLSEDEHDIISLRIT